ncbi:hypothetical protein [Nonomuraea sp. NPDC005501]|uniref:hypothetical protein n=1 Tax=Nonomuraea sp. NPDC005501 TaxID=3156884 RepID=UPI0033A33D09
MRVQPFLIALLAALPLATAPLPAAADGGRFSGRWSDGWATAVQRPTLAWFPTWSQQGFDNHSVRQMIQTTAAGVPLRVRMSNAYGTTPLRLT